MTRVRDLAVELRLHRVSVREFCRSRDIPMHRRLPVGRTGGQLEAFVTNRGARAIRDHYRDRLMTRTG